MANWGCQNSETPEPIDIKFGVGDYVGDITPILHSIRWLKINEHLENKLIRLTYKVLTPLNLYTTLFHQTVVHINKTKQTQTNNIGLGIAHRPIRLCCWTYSRQ